MKVWDLFQDTEKATKLKSIEEQLINRRTVGNIAGWAAVLSALAQILIIFIR
jgi:hypothetical protein